ncbi:DUF3152 domain-containing protein [Pseudonocardiaceae bacterium YIM PH 21723]|nr:DUF3152 domain-containing protein [Pseudonocardiaceae bacterium YIM PH 21723]
MRKWYLMSLSAAAAAMLIVGLAKADVRYASAELPQGAAFPHSGSGEFQVVPGDSQPVGTGTVRRYTVEIESAAGITDEQAAEFGSLVQETLSDRRGWTGAGLFGVQRTGGDADFQVTLVSQQTAERFCGGEEIPYEVSCYLGTRRVFINAARWFRGATSFHGDLADYRRYAINHEVGHFFGNQHAVCPASGAPAPVMMQQTLSVSNDELAAITRDSQGVSVPADGHVCRPNAWPYP